MSSPPLGATAADTQFNAGVPESVSPLPQPASSRQKTSPSNSPLKKSQRSDNGVRRVSSSPGCNDGASDGVDSYTTVLPTLGYTASGVCNESSGPTDDQLEKGQPFFCYLVPKVLQLLKEHGQLFLPEGEIMDIKSKNAPSAWTH